MGHSKRSHQPLRIGGTTAAVGDEEMWHHLLDRDLPLLEASTRGFLVVTEDMHCFVKKCRRWLALLELVVVLLKLVLPEFGIGTHEIVEVVADVEPLHSRIDPQDEFLVFGNTSGKQLLWVS